MPSVGLLLGGVAALAITCGWGFYERSEAIKYEAAASQAIIANASLVKDSVLAKVQSARNQQISAEALRDGAALADKIGRLKERVKRGDACLIDPDDARALDGLFE